MEELCAQCCRLVEFIICFHMCISRNIVYLCIQKFCSATGEKICSVNIDHESTFLMLGPISKANAPQSMSDSLNQEPTQSLWRWPWGLCRQLGPQIKNQSPMEQIVAPDQKPMGPLEQVGP